MAYGTKWNLPLQHVASKWPYLETNSIFKSDDTQIQPVSKATCHLNNECFLAVIQCMNIESERADENIFTLTSGIRSSIYSSQDPK